MTLNPTGKISIGGSVLGQSIEEEFYGTANSKIDLLTLAQDAGLGTANISMNSFHGVSVNDGLSSLSFSGITSQSFSSPSTSISLGTIGSGSLNVTPVAAVPYNATITVNGVSVNSASSTTVAISTGSTSFTVVVTKENYVSKTYTVSFVAYAPPGASGNYNVSFPYYSNIFADKNIQYGMYAVQAVGAQVVQNNAVKYLNLTNGTVVWSTNPYTTYSIYCIAAQISGDGTSFLEATVSGNPGGYTIWNTSGSLTRSAFYPSGWVQSPNPSLTPGYGIVMVNYSGTMFIGYSLTDAYTDPTGAYLGAFYVFTVSGTTWTQQAHIGCPGGKAAGTFSAPGGNNGISNSGTTWIAGAANNTTYVFSGSGSSWSNAVVSTLGTPLAISPDGSTIAVGNYTANGNIGVVYIYTGSGLSWSLQATINPTGYTAGTVGVYFGYAASFSSNGNVLAVTGVYDNGGGNNAGAVFTFTRQGSTWTQTGKINPTSAMAVSGQLFGVPVQLSLDGKTLGVGVENAGYYVYQ